MQRFYVVVALSVVVYFSNLGGTSIYILDEAKNAACAIEMRMRGDFIVPTFNGELRTDKPPVHYFFMMTAYSIFGVTPFAARFFSAFAGVLLIVVVYFNVKRLISERTALYTALVILCSIQLTIQFHLAVPDPYLILFIAIALFSFFRGFQGEPTQMTGCYAACALGFLTKGLIAIVLPGLIFALYIIFSGSLDRSILRRLMIGKGILLFCAIVIPWYAAVAYFTDGEWLIGFFIVHNLERYTSTMEGHKGFPLAPVVILLTALLPFSVFTVQSIKFAWQERASAPLLLFCLIVLAVFIVFFSFSRTILPSYPAPAIPFFAIIIGNYLTKLEDSNVRKNAASFSLVLNLIISVALFFVAFFVLKTEDALAELKWSIWIFLVPIIGALVGWYFYAKTRTRLFIYCWAVSWIILGLLFFYVVNPAIDSKNPVSASIALIEKKYPNHKIVGYHQFNPAFVFALQHPIDVVESRSELEQFSKHNSNIVVITRKKYLDDLPSRSRLEVVYSAKDLFEVTETVVLAN